MIIFGVDPGTIKTGFGVINFFNNEISYLACGTIQLASLPNLSLKLQKIYDELCGLIRKYDPDEFALETAFYGKNVQSALKIGYARGASMLAAVNNQLIVSEYSPREIKKAVVGTGAASKEQVNYMIKSLLAIKSKIKFDESDALAVAVCHCLKLKSPSSRGTKNWKSFVENNPEKVVG